MSSPDARPNPDTVLRDVGRELWSSIDIAVGPWVVRVVERLHRSWNGEFPDTVRDGAHRAADEARAAVMPRLRVLLEADVDEQRSTPLQLLRDVGSFPTAALREAGLPGVVRDAVDERLWPDDVYAIGPAALADVDVSLHTISLVWGAAKAKAHIARHQAHS